MIHRVNIFKIIIVFVLVVMFFSGTVLAKYQEYLADHRLIDAFFSKNGEKMITITEKTIDTWKIKNGKLIRVGFVDKVEEEKEVFKGKGANFLIGREGPYVGENYNLTISPDGSLWAYNNPDRNNQHNMVIVKRFKDQYNYQTDLKHIESNLYPLPNYHTDIWLAISPDNSEIAGYYKKNNTEDYYLYIWSLESGELIESTKLPNLKNSSQKIDYNYYHHNENKRYGFIEYSPDGKYIVVGGVLLYKTFFENSSNYYWTRDRAVKIVIDRETLEYNKKFNTPGFPSNIVFSPEKRMAFVKYGRYSDTYKIVDLEQMEEINTLKIIGPWDAAAGDGGLFGVMRWDDFKEFSYRNNKLEEIKSRTLKGEEIYDIAYNSREKLWLIAAKGEFYTIEATSENYLKAEAEFTEGLKLMEIGFYDKGKEKLKSAIALEPLKIKDIRQVEIYFNDLKEVPLRYRGEILAYHYQQLVSTKYYSDSREWEIKRLTYLVWKLIDYGILAGNAGYPALTGQAVMELEGLKNIDIGSYINKEKYIDFIEEGISLLEALTIALEEGSEQAYRYLLEKPKIDVYVVLYFTKYPQYVAPLFADRKKLAYLIDKIESNLPNPELAQINKVPFVDLEGSLIKPLDEAPLFENNVENENSKGSQNIHNNSHKKGTVLD